MCFVMVVTVRVVLVIVVLVMVGLVRVHGADHIVVLVMVVLVIVVLIIEVIVIVVRVKHGGALDDTWRFCHGATLFSSYHLMLIKSQLSYLYPFLHCFQFPFFLSILFSSCSM